MTPTTAGGPIGGPELIVKGCEMLNGHWNALGTGLNFFSYNTYVWSNGISMYNAAANNQVNPWTTFITNGGFFDDIVNLSDLWLVSWP